MLRAAGCLALLIPLAACAAQPDTRLGQAGVPQIPSEVDAPAIPSGAHEVMGSKFAVAGDGTVIPDNAPDASAQAYAARCAGAGGGAAVAVGMSECDLIGAKGTPSRVVTAADQQGGTHNAIWYIEGGDRVVYRFDNDRLAEIIR